MEESLHWLNHVMQVRKCNRIALLKELPEHYHCLATCRKTQMPYALLKLHIDSGKGLFYWPTSCDCTIPCDFCVQGNSATALAEMVPIIGKALNTNFITWWKRYVRMAGTSTFSYRDKTFYCFNLVDRPDFFKRDRPVTIEEKHSDRSRMLETTPAASQVAASNDPEPTSEHTTTVYRCKICHQPRKGHKCGGIAPPPIPESLPETFANPTLPPPLVLSSSVGALRGNFTTAVTKRDDFASMFVEEKNNDRGPSRLEKIFKKQKIDTRIEKEIIETDIDLLDE